MAEQKFEIPIYDFIQLAEFFRDNGADIRTIMDDKDVKSVSESRLLEKGKQSIVTMSAKEKYDKRLAIKIPNGIDDKISGMIEQGKKYAFWYEEINDIIASNLDESDSALFLMLLGATSPANGLDRNFDEATVLFMGIKKDIALGHEQLLMKFATSPKVGGKFSYTDAGEFSELLVVNAMKTIQMAYTGSKIMNIRSAIRMYISSKFKISKSNTAQYMIKNFQPYSPTAIDIYPFSKQEDVFGRAKVYNFTLNLLNPDLYKKVSGNNWGFVTIDTHMLKLFYPEMPKENRDKIFGHNAQYLHLHKKVNDIAKKTGMNPPQVQAALWVAQRMTNEKDFRPQSFGEIIAEKEQALSNLNLNLEKVHNKMQKLLLGLDYYVTSLKPQLDKEAKKEKDRKEWEEKGLTYVDPNEEAGF